MRWYETTVGVRGNMIPHDENITIFSTENQILNQYDVHVENGMRTIFVPNTIFSSKMSLSSDIGGASNCFAPHAAIFTATVTPSSHENSYFT